MALPLNRNRRGRRDEDSGGRRGNRRQPLVAERQKRQAGPDKHSVAQIYAHDRNNNRAASFEQPAVPGLREGCGPRRLKMSIDFSNPSISPVSCRRGTASHRPVRDSRQTETIALDVVHLTTSKRRRSAPSGGAWIKKAELKPEPCATDSGTNFVECAPAALDVHGRSAFEIFGSPDTVKLQSSATLFALVSPPSSVSKLWKTPFQGRRNKQTLSLVWWVAEFTLVTSVTQGAQGRGGPPRPRRCISNHQA